MVFISKGKQGNRRNISDPDLFRQTKLFVMDKVDFAGSL